MYTMYTIYTNNILITIQMTSTSTTTSTSFPCHYEGSFALKCMKSMISTGQVTLIPKPSKPCSTCGKMLIQYEIIYNKN